MTAQDLHVLLPSHLKRLNERLDVFDVRHFEPFTTAPFRAEENFQDLRGLSHLGKNHLYFRLYILQMQDANIHIVYTFSIKPLWYILTITKALILATLSFKFICCLSHKSILCAIYFTSVHPHVIVLLQPVNSSRVVHSVLMNVRTQCLKLNCQQHMSTFKAVFLRIGFVSN